MSTLRDIADHAFRLHEAGRLTRENLLRVLSACVDAVALENGYASTYGLPSSQRRSRAK